MEINLKYGYQQIINDSFEEVERRAQRVLSEVGFGVLTKVNVKETLKEKLDVNFNKYTILGVCNPSLALEALSSDKGVGLFMPCNVVIWENDDGTTAITAFDATIMSKSFKNNEISALAHKVNEIIKSALNKI
tara:strand:+ start:627 stop:1025 length:399 start_codon:yes stop_codon:yes gene_type:complete